MSNVIQISCLGTFGRFGNQLHQYAFARKYAKATGSILQTPKWIGQKLFGFEDEPLGAPLPKVGLDYIPNGKVNIDLQGWYRSHEAMSGYTYSELRSLFAFKPEYLEQWKSEWFKEHWDVPTNYTAVHIRRGDFIRLNQPLIDITCYWKKLLDLGISPHKAHYFSEVLAKKRDISPDLEFLPDFLSLMHANTLLRANSSFSWWAGALSTGRVFAPVTDERYGMQYVVPFVEGNWPKVMASTRNSGRVTDIFLE